jgi:hypothetical protein
MTRCAPIANLLKNPRISRVISLGRYRWKDEGASPEGLTEEQRRERRLDSSAFFRATREFSINLNPREADTSPRLLPPSLRTSKSKESHRIRQTELSLPQAVLYASSTIFESIANFVSKRPFYRLAQGKNTRRALVAIGLTHVQLSVQV